TGVPHDLLADGLHALGEGGVGAQHRGKIRAAKLGHLLVASKDPTGCVCGCATEFAGRFRDRRFPAPRRHFSLVHLVTFRTTARMLRCSTAIWHAAAPLQATLCDATRRSVLEQNGLPPT